MVAFSQNQIENRAVIKVGITFLFSLLIMFENYPIFS